jgi:hypothetical protein
VRTYGDDTAIITAAFERPDARKVASGSIRVTVVWIKQNGRWRAFTLTRLKSKQTQRTPVRRFVKIRLGKE